MASGVSSVDLLVIIGIPLSPLFVSRFFERNSLALDRGRKPGFFVIEFRIFFHPWDLAAAGAEKCKLDVVLPPEVYYTGGVKGWGDIQRQTCG
jgi:hypothetical protein